MDKFTPSGRVANMLPAVIGYAAPGVVGPDEGTPACDPYSRSYSWHQLHSLVCEQELPFYARINAARLANAINVVDSVLARFNTVTHKE